MRIAYVTETWLPSSDGIITRLLATIDQLLAAGHEVLVIAPRTDRPDLPGVVVRTVPTIHFSFVYGGQSWGLPLPRVARYLDEFRPDVVHLLNPVLIGIAGSLTARSRGYPLIASYHTDVARYARDYRLSWIVPLLEAHLRRIHGAAHVNLATSATGRLRLSSHGITESRLWPAGVDLDTYIPIDLMPEDRLPVRLPVRRTGSKPTALYVGRVAAEKELHRLQPLADPGSPFHLTIVGDGPARQDLQRRFGPHVTFTGTLTGAALAAAYRDADVFVFPSTTETLGLVLMEALASGLPVVAYDSPASRDLLSDCQAARLVPADHHDQHDQQPTPGDGRLIAAISELLSQPQDQLRRAARAHVEDQSWHRATSVLLDHYRTAIEAAHS